MSKKTKNHKEIEEAINICNEHSDIVCQAHDLLEALKDNMTKTEKEKYPGLLSDLEYIIF